MELLQLTYFKDAAETQNFSAVAKKYYVAQPSVSYAISKLEEELGTKLFTRKGNKVVLNKYGEAFYSEIKISLEHLERAKSCVSNLKENSFTLSLHEGAVAVIPMVADFKKQYPDIDVNFTLTDSRNPDIDIMIRTLPFTDDDKYDISPLFVEKIIVALPENSPLAEKQTLSIDDLRNQPIIGLAKGYKMYQHINAYFELNDYTPNIVVSSSNNGTIAAYVKSGFGIAFFPELSWAGILGEGIVSRPFADFDSRRTIYFAYRKDAQLNEAALKFIEFGKEYFDKLQHNDYSRIKIFD